MPIVNPYLKKKAVTGPTSSSSPLPPTTIMTGQLRPSPVVTPAKVSQPVNRVQVTVVTPQAITAPKTVARAPAPAPALPSTSAKSSLSLSRPPPIAPPMNASARHKAIILSPESVSAEKSRHPTTVLTSGSRGQTTLSKKLTLKQKLKQEIAALKKQKQLMQLQKEAQERRKRTELERAAKEEERKRFVEARQAQQQARLDEKMRKQEEKAQALERKRQERLAMQQAVVAKQEQTKRDYEQALLQYQRDSEEYRIRHSQWLQERQHWIISCQQQLFSPCHSPGNPPSYAPQFFHGPAMVGYPEMPLVPTSMGNHFPMNSGFNPHHSTNTLLPTHVTSMTTTMNMVSPQPTLAIAGVANDDLSPSYPATSIQVHAGNSLPHAPLAPPRSIPEIVTSNAFSAPTPHGSALICQSSVSPVPPYAFPPHPVQSMYYSAPQNYPQTINRIMDIMSLMPTHLKVPPIPPIPPKKPKCWMNKKAPTVIEQRLAAVMESPSPYAATHVLHNITLIRSHDQPSFGVNLKAVTTALLVDPPKKEMKAKDTTKATPNHTKSNMMLCQAPTKHSAAIDQVSGGKVETPNPNEPADNDLTSSTTNASVKGEISVEMDINQDTISQKEEAKFTIGWTIDEQSSDDKTTSTMLSTTLVESKLAENNEANAMDVDPNIECRIKLEQLTATENTSLLAEKQDKPLLTTSALSTITNIPVASSAQSRKPRRRRINFTVMMVVDAEKQNDRWKEQINRQNIEDVDCEKQLLSEESLDLDALDKHPSTGNKTMEEQLTLLEPGDIVISIGGIDVTGKSFAEACRIFGEKTEERTVTSQNGDIRTELQATLVVARKKKAQIVSKCSKPNAIKCKSSCESQLTVISKKFEDSPRPFLHPNILSLPANASLSFSTAEIAVLADCVIQALHDQPTSRLLGQELSAVALAKNTAIFQKVASLKSCILNHRNTETLFSKWSQLCQGIATSLAERSRTAWTKHALTKESTSEIGAFPYSSDAERTALRQLPRPAKGCRCQRRDHEYLHDVRCILYQDICRLLPSEELQELQHDPDHVKKSKAADIKLNTVETAFKDRIVRLKAATEMEEAEARFVARMEEVQVQQIRKAIFAPNLASMVLSSILELQREFPVSTDPLIDRFRDDLDDEIVPDDEFSSGKRKQNSMNRESKRAKVNGVRNINVKYLFRIVQHIGKTWGHVYREPSHEDYAWYVSLSFESQDTNESSPFYHL